MRTEMASTVLVHESTDEEMSCHFQKIYSEKRCTKLPSLPVSEIEEIASFVEQHRKVILQMESFMLDRMIDEYERVRTFEARQRLKTFLLYLRRCACPSPSVLPATPKNCSHLRTSRPIPALHETPKRRPTKRLSRAVSDQGFCHCEKCIKKRKFYLKKAAAVYEKNYAKVFKFVKKAIRKL